MPVVAASRTDVASGHDRGVRTSGHDSRLRTVIHAPYSAAG